MKQKILTFSPLSEKELQKLMPETSPEQLFRDGKAHYEEAFRLFRKAAEQGSAEAQAYLKLYPEYQQTAERKHTISETLQNVKVNDIVRFGKYDWYVIKKSADRCTLLCKEIVCEEAYHNSAKYGVRWQDCTLRKWLNDSFYHKFSEEDKKMIAQTFRDGCDSGYDNIYLLSREEVKKINRNICSCGAWWWLRADDYILGNAGEVYSYKDFNPYGYPIDKICGVRPALTLKF